MEQVNNCVIDWLTPWPEEALHSVACVFLDEVDIPESMRIPIVKHMVMVHSSVSTLSVDFKQKLRRHNYVTPKNFLDFIMKYRNSLASCRKNNSDMSARLSGGLGKLIQAKQEVAVMQVMVLLFCTKKKGSLYSNICYSINVTTNLKQ